MDAAPGGAQAGCSPGRNGRPSVQFHPVILCDKPVMTDATGRRATPAAGLQPSIMRQEGAHLRFAWGRLASTPEAACIRAGL
jgi:hypothetical protein